MKQSAGLLMYRRGLSGVDGPDAIEVFLVHPGGPYWVKKDKGWWTIPKGEFEEGEEPLAAARREFTEETGFDSQGPFVELGTYAQSSRKMVTGFAFEGDCEAEKLVSNTCEIEWPPRSGKRMKIPEVDRGAWYGLVEARRWIRPGQAVFLDVLERTVDAETEGRNATAGPLRG
jgi:predicted NUDIX family NTP pyrophosphohydrolase